MAEVGWVRFARLALEVSRKVLPAQRSKFSKRVFTQPQLPAVLCLMGYEDWTFREAEVRRSEHTELRSALALKAVPDYTTLYRFLARLNVDDVARVMDEMVRRMPGRWRKPALSLPKGPATVGSAATGLAQGAVSSYFIRRAEHFGQPQRTWRHGLKWLAVVDLKRQLILAQHARQAPWNDCATLPALVTRARRHPAIGCNKPLHVQGIRVRLHMREHFPAPKYALRSLVESVFSAVKRKLSCRAPGRTFHTPSRQALLLGLAFDLYRL